MALGLTWQIVWMIRGMHRVQKVCWYMKQEQQPAAACGRVVGAAETLISACRCVATLMGLVLAVLELSMSKTLIGVIIDSMERSWWPRAARAEPSSGESGWGLRWDWSRRF